MESVKELLVILVSSSLVSNVVLSQFLGLCPFLGVSKKINTAAGMGGAVIFVITLASAVSGAIYKFVLQRFQVEYLETIVFILVIAALVQFVEMFLKKAMPALYEALGVYLPLVTTNAIVILAGIREKIEHNDIPRPFRGMPAVLLTAGLMAIAFCGFAGLISM